MKKNKGIFPIIQKDIRLEYLVGDRVMTGYREYIAKPDEDDYYDTDSQIVEFVLNGFTYRATEDPDDGYRSSMSKIERFQTPFPKGNIFEGIEVSCKMRTYDEDNYGGNNILEITDKITDKIILSIGTDNCDDYYPMFVHSWNPEDMSLNMNK